MDGVTIRDEILIQQIAQGSTDGLGILYDRYGRLVYALGVKITGDAGQAEEIVQEVFLRVWQGASSYDSTRGKVFTWLFTIAHNMCIDEVRRRKNRPQAVSPSPDSEQDPVLMVPDSNPESNIEETVWSNEIARAVRDALQQLPPEQSRVIEMSYFQGLTHKQIAERLGLPLGTAKTRMVLGLKRMRQILGRLGFEPSG